MIDTSVLNIDFEILGCSTNCKALKIVDLSNWGPAISNASYIDITTPGSTLAITNTFQKQIINVFNTNNLNLSDVQDYSSLGNLPDGAYQICVRVCMGNDPNGMPQFEKVCKYFLQDCMLRCKIAKKIMAIDMSCEVCKQNWLDDILEAQLFLDGAHAQIDNCNVNKAMEYYMRATQIFERLQQPHNDMRFRNKSEHCPECWPGRAGWTER